MEYEKTLEYRSDKIHLTALISPGSNAVKSDLDVTVHPGVHVLPDAHPHGVGLPWGSSWWHLSPSAVDGGLGREKDQQEPPPRAGTALPSHSEMGWEMLRKSQACCGVPEG